MMLANISNEINVREFFFKNATNAICKADEFLAVLCSQFFAI